MSDYAAIVSSEPCLWEESSRKMSLRTERSSSYVDVSVHVCVHAHVDYKVIFVSV